MPNKPKAPILIAGPTASGKSALAVELAETLDGVVINADSMQVYRELAVLTARPSQRDEAVAPHKLYGFVPAAKAYSVGCWLSDVAREIEVALAVGRVPIVVGGTGLYFKALLEGLAHVPEIEGSIRAYWRHESVRLSAPALHGILAERDPPMAARLRPQDTQRIVRALEVIDATGRSLSEWRNIAVRPIVDAGQAVKIVAAPARDYLYDRCDARFDAMIDGDALGEVAALMAQDLDPGLPAMRALGVEALIEHLRGELGLDESRARIKIETRRYAKRQITWLRSNMITWKWYDEKDVLSIMPKILAFIDV